MKTELRKVSIVFLRRVDEVLLAMKKRGFGQGRWNGTGGKPETDETVEDSARRETQEEIGVTPKGLRHVATISFFFPEAKAKQGWNQQAWVYLCEDWEGEPTETEEMAPKWFNIDAIPYDEMWPDDRYWYPRVLAGKFVEAEFHFGDNDEVLDHFLRERAL